ncbi:MAG: HK97 family phage prohead protease, partial [Vicinamibacteria bacterium]|nr:HK97 family phage prohead protease [Vicinamibacteria bacterium]
MPQSLAARPRAPLHSPHRRPAPPPGHARHDAASWPAPAYETKLAQLDLVSAVDDSGTFEGYASLFHREDLGRDVIVPGAFRASLAKRGAGGIRMLYQHDPAQPIGVWLAIAEDGRGLRVKGRLIPDVARAREVLALMRSGALDGLSIGYRAVKATRDAKTQIRRLTEIDLWEISIVTFPMLPDARIARVKRLPRSSYSPRGERSGAGVGATAEARLAAAISRAAFR